MVDYPAALPYFVNEQRVFIGALADPRNRYAIVIHKTACGSICTAQEQGVFFQTNAQEKSVHYVVGKDGTVVQCVREVDGAGGNCCLENGYDTFWDSAPTKSNINLCTYSIEHCDYSSDNSDPVTPEQQAASFKLVAYLAHKYNIGMDHIKGHNTLDPISRARCPGNYPWSELFTYLKGEGVMTPAGWNLSPDGSKLTCPNGHFAVLGMKDYIENYPGGWDPANYLLEEEHHLDSVEESNMAIGPGQVQLTRTKRLEYTESRGVFECWLGVEYQYVKADRDNCRAIIAQLQTQINALKAGVPQQDFTAVQSSITKLMSDLQAMMK